MPLPARRQDTRLYLVSSNDPISLGGTKTELHVYNLRRAIPLVVDSVPAEDPFNSLMDALHGVGG